MNALRLLGQEAVSRKADIAFLAELISPRVAVETPALWVRSVDLSDYLLRLSSRISACKAS